MRPDNLTLLSCPGLDAAICMPSSIYEYVIIEEQPSCDACRQGQKQPLDAQDEQRLKVHVYSLFS